RSSYRTLTTTASPPSSSASRRSASPNSASSSPTPGAPWRRSRTWSTTTPGRLGGGGVPLFDEGLGGAEARGLDDELAGLLLADGVEAHQHDGVAVVVRGGE